MTDDSIPNSSLTSACSSPMYDIQICGSSDDSYKGTESCYATDEGTKKGHKEEKWENKEARYSDGFVTAKDAVDLRDSSQAHSGQCKFE